MNSSEKPNKSNPNRYLRYTSVAFEMLGFILLGVWGGSKLDAWWDLDKPIMTAVCSMIAVLASMVNLIRNLPKS